MGERGRGFITLSGAVSVGYGEAVSHGTLTPASQVRALLSQPRPRMGLMDSLLSNERVKGALFPQHTRRSTGVKIAILYFGGRYEKERIRGGFG